jgi:hypothetical protein
MPAAIHAQPDTSPLPTGTTTVPAGHGWAQAALDTITGHESLLYASLALAAVTLIFLARKALKIAKSERPDESLSNLGMIIGFGWSSEAVWVITGPGGADLPTPIRVALFAVLEVVLIVFMIRAKRNVDTLGNPGRAGRIAWAVAAGMATVAVWTAHNPGEAFLRLLIPIVLTAMWWDGLVPEGVKKAAGPSSWRWTPRRLLLWLGALEPGERDVETVHRDRLTQQMTQLEFRRRYGNPNSQKRSAKKLARLSLTADDEIITEVRQRVSRASWFTVTPIVTHLDGDTETTFDNLAKPVRKRSRDAEVAVPPTRRVKAATRAATSNDAGGADPATQAARLFLTQEVDSIREAARRIPGASEATVRRRVNDARDNTDDAPTDRVMAQPVTRIPEPNQPVLAGVNGNHPTLAEETP